MDANHTGRIVRIQKRPKGGVYPHHGSCLAFGGNYPSGILWAARRRILAMCLMLLVSGRNPSGKEPGPSPAKITSTPHAGGPSNRNTNYKTMQTQNQKCDRDTDRDLNRDPLTGEPGSHPVGTGLGAAGGAATGAAIGSVAGPAGTFVGGVIGAVAGGFAGKGVAEQIDPTAEDEYWQEKYENESYYDNAANYDDYGPAYRTGYTGYAEHGGKTFDEAEPALRNSWESVKDRSRLTWDKAKHASRAAWDRVERALPGDSDGDGK